MSWATVISMPRHYLIVIGDAAALAWVLAEQRMAFPARRRSQAMALEVGDELLIYTTRHCFRSPARDHGRVMGLANVTTRVRNLAEPVVFGERRYTEGCALTIHGVAALRTGVEVAPLVTELHAFPDARKWNMRMRRALVPLDEHDASLLGHKLTALLEPVDHHLDAYLQIAERRKYSKSRSRSSNVAVLEMKRPFSEYLNMFITVYMARSVNANHWRVRGLVRRLSGIPARLQPDEWRWLGAQT